MTKVKEVIFEDEKEQIAETPAITKKENIEITDETIEEMFNLTPIEVEEVKTLPEMVKVTPVRDSNNCVGGVWYYLQKGRDMKVPFHVYEFLARNTRNPKIKM